MARTAVNVTTLSTTAAGTAEAAGTSIDATNSHVVTLGATPLEEVVIRAVNTTASTKTLTVKAGDSPPADAAGQGDLVVSFTAGNVTPVVKYIGPLSSARYLQNDGTLNIDVAASMTGTIEAYVIPRV